MGAQASKALPELATDCCSPFRTIHTKLEPRCQWGSMRSGSLRPQPSSWKSPDQIHAGLCVADEIPGLRHCQAGAKREQQFSPLGPPSCPSARRCHGSKCRPAVTSASASEARPRTSRAVRHWVSRDRSDKSMIEPNPARS
jgi:hypothetical protein